MRKLVLGAVVLFVAGCGAKVTHTLVANIPEDVPAGICALVEGPYVIPSGSSTSYSVFDNVQDDMDIAVVDASVGCVPASGYAYTSGIGSVHASEAVPGSTYYLAIACYNADGLDCIPTVDSWSYED